MSYCDVKQLCHVNRIKHYYTRDDSFPVALVSITDTDADVISSVRKNCNHFFTNVSNVTTPLKNSDVFPYDPG